MCVCCYKNKTKRKNLWIMKATDKMKNRRNVAKAFKIFFNELKIYDNTYKNKQ